MDKKKQETPKRKVVQIKPKPKKEGIDFSKDEVIVLVSILKDKDRVSMFRKLNEISSCIILTSIPDNPRASTAKELYDYVENKKDFEYEEDPIKAYNLALSKKRKLTICCGSFYILIKLKEGLNG